MGGSDTPVRSFAKSAADQEITVELQSTKTADPELALKQIARIISIDYDGNESSGVGERDRIIAKLQTRFPGHRPMLFHSPDQAAAWSIISAPKPSAAAARTRTAISERLGHSFTLAGQTVHAFPQPDALSDLTDFPGLDQAKARRLHKIADAGAELQADALKSRGPKDAFIYAQTLEGIGPSDAVSSSYAQPVSRTRHSKSLNPERSTTPPSSTTTDSSRSNASPNSLRTGDHFAPGPPSSSASPPPTPEPNNKSRRVRSGEMIPELEVSRCPLLDGRAGPSRRIR